MYVCARARELMQTTSFFENAGAIKQATQKTHQIKRCYKYEAVFARTHARTHATLTHLRAHTSAIAQCQSKKSEIRTRTHSHKMYFVMLD